MVTFKYVDDFEKLVKDFLEYQYKENAWLFEDKKKGKTIAASIKDEKTLPWLESFGLQQKLLDKIEELRNNLKDTKKEKPSLIDDVNKQLTRIQQLNILLNHPPRFYQDWKEQKLPTGVDISLLPEVAAFFKGVKTIETEQNVDSSKKIQDDPNNAEKQLDDVIKTISIEVDQLYEGMKNLLNGIDKSLGKERYNACLKYFKENLSKFSHIQEKHLVYKPKYWDDENASRGVKGGILEQYLRAEHFKLFNNKKLRTKCQSLFNRHNDLKKTD